MEARKRRSQPIVYRLTEVNGIHLPVGKDDSILPPRAGRRKLIEDDEILRLRSEIAREVFSELLYDLTDTKNHERTAVSLLRQLADMLERG